MGEDRRGLEVEVLPLVPHLTVDRMDLRLGFESAD